MSAVLVMVTSAANQTSCEWHVIGGAFGAAIGTSVPGEAVHITSPVAAETGLTLVQLAIQKALWQLTNSPRSDLPDPCVQRAFLLLLKCPRVPLLPCHQGMHRASPGLGCKFFRGGLQPGLPPPVWLLGYGCT